MPRLCRRPGGVSNLVAPPLQGADDGFDGGANVTASAWLFGAAGTSLAGIGVFFVFLRSSLLPEDLRFLGRGSSEIDEFMPQLRRWLRRVFTVLGGHALAAGGLTVFVAATEVRDGHPAAVVALAFAGAVSIGLMAVVNFSIRSNFRWMLLAVAGLWVAATVAAMWR